MIKVDKNTIKIGLLIFFLSVSFLVQAQEWRPIYTSKWDHLLANPQVKTSVIGVLATEASITLLDSTKTHYKIRVSNGDEGYIEKQPLKKAMFGIISEGEPKQYFHRGENNTQGPHLYVQVSELRVRNRPSTEGKPIRKLRLNEYVALDYMPLNPDSWLYIGDHFHKEPEYIQAKYLGAELTYKKLLESYLKVKNTDSQEELNLVGRLREMSWSEQNSTNILSALTYWKDSYDRASKSDPKVDLQFEMLLASKIAKSLSYQDYEKKMKSFNIHFEWNNQKLFDGKILERDLINNDWVKLDQIENFPECGWEPTSFYKKEGVIIAMELDLHNKLVGTVYESKFISDIQLCIGSERLDSNSDEKVFVEKFGSLLSVDWVQNPHVYRFNSGDAGQLILTFKDGKLAFYECMYYC